MRATKQVGNRLSASTKRRMSSSFCIISHWRAFIGLTVLSSQSLLPSCHCVNAFVPANTVISNPSTRINKCDTTPLCPPRKVLQSIGSLLPLPLSSSLSPSHYDNCHFTRTGGHPHSVGPAPTRTSTTRSSTTATALHSSFSSSNTFRQHERPWYALFSQGPKQQDFLKKCIHFSSRIVLSLVVLTGGLLALPFWVMAASSSSSVLSSTSTTGIFRGKLPSIKTSLRLAALSFAVTFVIRYIRLQKRQALDATSEWSRYANHPGTRARALGSLIFLQLLPLWIVTRLLRVVRLHDRAQAMRTRTGNVFADGLLRLGPLYIKMGQILSCRDNLFPPEWIAAMEKLQDQVPARRGQDALNLAYEAMGSQEQFEQIFEDFDPEPLAAASLGQVHMAVLRKEILQQYNHNYSGDDDDGVVAVKIQRAKLREIYDQDLVVLNKIAAVMDKMGNTTRANVGGVDQSWTDIFQDAEEILYREIDYRDEATNARRFADDFGLDIGGKPLKRRQSSSSSSPSPIVATSKDGEPLPSAASWLRTPYVYTDLSTEKVLVMEYVPSIKITNKAKLDAANVTWEEREYLSDMLARSYLRQFCCNLFFSTDPHPGNLGVEILESKTSSSAKDSRRVRLVFYDFGQAAVLNVNQADGILDIIEAIIDLNVERSVEAFQTMGVLKEDANLDMVRAKVGDNYRTGKIKANQKKLKRQGYKSSGATSSSATTSNTSATNTTTNSSSTSGKDSEVMKFFTLPAEYAFVARALSQMDGVGKTLDPDFDFVSSAAPYIVEIKGAGKYIKDEIKKRLTNFWTEFRGPYGKSNVPIIGQSAVHHDLSQGPFLLVAEYGRKNSSKTKLFGHNGQYHGHVPLWTATRERLTMMNSRLDTLHAAGFVKHRSALKKSAPDSCILQATQRRKSILPLQSAIGLFGHTGLLLVSTLLVMIAKQLIKTIKESNNNTMESKEEDQPAGVLNRCPWPFIFSHDPVQGMKDPPTWIVITWFALWRIIKAMAKRKIPG